MVNFWTMLDQLGYPFMCSRCVLASRSPSIVLNLQMKFRSDACIGVVHVDGLRICGARSAGTGATAATSTPTSHTTRRISEHQSAQSRRNPNGSTRPGSTHSSSTQTPAERHVPVPVPILWPPTQPVRRIAAPTRGDRPSRPRLLAVTKRRMGAAA